MLYLCVLRIHVCEGVSILLCMCVWRLQINISVSLHQSPRGLLLNLELTVLPRLVGQQALGLSCLHIPCPVLRVTDAHCHAQLFRGILESELRSVCSDSKHFTHRAVSLVPHNVPLNGCLNRPTFFCFFFDTFFVLKRKA